MNKATKMTLIKAISEALTNIMATTRNKTMNIGRCKNCWKS